MESIAGAGQDRDGSVGFVPLSRGILLHDRSLSLVFCYIVRASMRSFDSLGDMDHVPNDSSATSVDF